jgi:AbrB family looped-hinge helix DNA binding protein
MAKVTSKFQVTVPKAIARRYNIEPGGEIRWVEAGDIVHVIPQSRQSAPGDINEKLRLFDQSTARQKKARRPVKKRAGGKAWAREELYTRGRSR